MSSRIPIVPKCCFIIALDLATLLVGCVAMVISVTGVMSAITNVSLVFHTPSNRIWYLLLEVIFFLGVHGVVFHSALLLISGCLILGSVREYPPLLIPWIAWTPFIIIAVIVNVAIVLNENSGLIIPGICFGMLVAIVLIYSTIIVTFQFKELIKFETRRSFLEGLTGLRPNQGYQAYFDRDRQTVQIIPSGTDVPVKPIMSSSKKKLDMNSPERETEPHLRESPDVNSVLKAGDLQLDVFFCLLGIKLKHNEPRRQKRDEIL